MRNPASKAHYIESNETIERMSRICHFSLMRWTFPSLILPQYFDAIVNYFKSDSDENVNHLPFPMMYGSSNAVNY